MRTDINKSTEIKKINISDIDPETGDVIAFSNWGLIGTIIKIFTQSKICHVGIMIDQENIMEALREGVVITKLSEVLKRRDRIFVCKLDMRSRLKIEKHKDQLDKFVKQSVGKKYDYWQCIMAGLDHNLKLTANRTGYKKFFCSELDGAYLQTAKILTLSHLRKLELDTVSDMTPEDICDLDIYDYMVEIQK